MQSFQRWSQESEEKWVKRFGQLNDMFVYKKSLIMETRLGYSISGEDEEIIEWTLVVNPSETLPWGKVGKQRACILSTKLRSGAEDSVNIALYSFTLGHLWHWFKATVPKVNLGLWCVDTALLVTQALDFPTLPQGNNLPSLNNYCPRELQGLV